MRTKTLLLAGAALAFSLATSQAQVYSANVVGYTTVVLPAGPSYTLLASPFDDGNGNKGTNWLDPNNTLPGKTAISTFSGGVFNTGTKIGSAWNANSANILIPPGTGFFVFLPATQTTPITNTFVGTVIVPSGGSITNTIPTGYSLWGSPIPYAGDLILDTTNIAFGKLLVTGKDAISIWTGTAYSTATYLAATGWNTTNASPLTVGAGFFVFQKGNYSTNWIQTATY